MRRVDISRLAVGTPIVRLSRWSKSIPICAKLEHLLPTGCVYDRVATPVLGEHSAESAEQVHRPVIVAGSGAVCLSFAAAGFSERELLFVCPTSILPEHRKLLERHRAVVVESPADRGLPGCHQRAVEEQNRCGGALVHSPRSTEAAAAAFSQSIGAELVQALLHWEAGAPPDDWKTGAPPDDWETGAPPDAMVVPVGSGSLIQGLARALRAANLSIAVYGVVARDRASATLIDGLATASEVAHIQDPMLQSSEALVGQSPSFPPGRGPKPVRWFDVAAIDAWRTRMELARTEGLLVGLNSAAALHAARVLGGRNEIRSALAMVVDAGDRWFSRDHWFRARAAA